MAREKHIFNKYNCIATLTIAIHVWFYISRLPPVLRFWLLSIQCLISVNKRNASSVVTPSENTPDRGYIAVR